MSKFYVIKYCQAFLAVSSSFKSQCLYAYSYFCGLNTQNHTVFHANLPRSILVLQSKICVTYPINANIAIIIGDSQQKYVVLKAMRRSGGISKVLLMKTL